MHVKIDTNLNVVNLSPSRMHERPKVNKLEVEDNIVLEVTLVNVRLKLNVSWAANQRGATWMTQHCKHCLCIADFLAKSCQRVMLAHHQGCMLELLIIQYLRPHIVHTAAV